MMKTRMPSETTRPGSAQDIAETDKRLAQLLVRRTRALAKSAADRREAGKPLVSPAQEKARITSYNVCYTKLLRCSHCHSRFAQAESPYVTRSHGLPVQR